MHKKLGQIHLSTIIRVSIAFFLLFSSAAIVYIAAQNYGLAKKQATQALKLTALSLVSSIENTLLTTGTMNGDEIRRIFSDRVVAYALIAKEDGKIIFHTNPNLVGSYLSKKPDEGRSSEKDSGRRIKLGTGLPAYEFDYILRNSDDTHTLLRLVLHTTFADRLVWSARRIWWTVGGIVVLLWVVGVMLEQVFTRHLRLQKNLEQQKRLALIGQMTAVLAHEIRNALSSVKGYVQLVDEKLRESDPKKIGLSIVLQGVRRIETLVNDLLLFSRNETYQIEPLDPIPLIHEAIHCSHLDCDRNVELKAKPGIQVMGDREKLYRVFLNGIRNAIQAMEDNKRLRISVYPDGRWIDIHIEDTGTGISDEEIPRLFTPFHTTKIDGTGLGLAYSKKVIEGMGGKISLANRDDENGAIMTIKLPKGSPRKKSSKVKESEETHE